MPSFLEEQKNGFRIYRDGFGSIAEPVAEVEIFVDEEADELRILVTKLEHDPTVVVTVL